MGKKCYNADGEETIDWEYYSQKARERQAYWRLIFSDGGVNIDISTMDWDEILEANAALDIFMAEAKKKVK